MICEATQAGGGVSEDDRKGRRTKNGFYPVHFQQHARFPLRIAEGGVGQAGADAQDVSPEATHFLGCVAIVLHEVLSFYTILVLLLLRFIVF